MNLYSYVVEHDTGFAPHVAGRYCTLVCCKFSAKGHWKNIVERAQQGDWIVGTGGAGNRSAGHGRIIYAMKVNESLTLKEYCAHAQLRDRKDADRRAIYKHPWRRALVSSHFYYFGAHAIGIPKRFLDIEKRGPGYKCKFEPEFIRRFVNWIERKKPGKHGPPCMGKHSICHEDR